MPRTKTKQIKKGPEKEKSITPINLDNVLNKVQKDKKETDTNVNISEKISSLKEKVDGMIFKHKNAKEALQIFILKIKIRYEQNTDQQVTRQTTNKNKVTLNNAKQKLTTNNEIFKLACEQIDELIKSHNITEISLTDMNKKVTKIRDKLTNYIQDNIDKTKNFFFPGDVITHATKQFENTISQKIDIQDIDNFNKCIQVYIDMLNLNDFVDQECTGFTVLDRKQREDIVQKLKKFSNGKWSIFGNAASEQSFFHRAQSGAKVIKDDLLRLKLFNIFVVNFNKVFDSYNHTFIRLSRKARLQKYLYTYIKQILTKTARDAEQLDDCNDNDERKKNIKTAANLLSNIQTMVERLKYTDINTCLDKVKKSFLSCCSEPETLDEEFDTKIKEMNNKIMSNLVSLQKNNSIEK